MAAPAPIQPASPLRISVITAVKNGQAFIGQTMESVLSQRYADVEYIVIDGGSTDGTVNIIKSHASRLAHWISEKDEGIADAFNKGVSFATGEYFLVLNADDALADAQVLERIAAQIVANGSPTMLNGDCDVLDRRTGKVLNRASIDVSRKELLLGKMIPHPSLFTHRSYFEKYGRFDPRFKIAMDYDWLLRGWGTERIVHAPLLVTNVRDGGMSTLARTRVVDEIIAALKKNGYLASIGSELGMRAYYRARSFAKTILGGMGLYQAFSQVRNRRRGTG